MISFLTPESDFPDISAAVMKAHAQFTEARLMEALIARFGELPSSEDIATHCKCFVDPDNVSHYLWFDVVPDFKVGGYVDLEQAFCVIAPPKIFTTNPEMQ